MIEADAPLLIDFFLLDVEKAKLEALKGIEYEAFRFLYMPDGFSELSRFKFCPEQSGYSFVEKFYSQDYLFSGQLGVGRAQ